MESGSPVSTFQVQDINFDCFVYDGEDCSGNSARTQDSGKNTWSLYDFAPRSSHFLCRRLLLCRRFITPDGNHFGFVLPAFLVLEQ